MKEFSRLLTPHLVAGLRRDSRNPFNAVSLATLTGLKPAAGQLVAHHEFAPPVDFTEEVLTPIYPTTQCFRGEQTAWLVGEDYLRAWDVAARTSEPETLYDSATLEEATIEQEGHWHFVDIQNTFLLLNGTCTILRANLGYLDEGYDEKTLISTEVVPQAACYHRGRLLLGGFSPGSTVQPFGTFQKNFVCWSSIGQGDVTWPFVNAVMPADAPARASYFRRNDSGFMPMPFSGKVLALKTLGNNVVAYGEDGIALLVQRSEPVPTFGLKMLLHRGILSRCAVAGSEDRHVFIDTKGIVWAINESLEISRLGYSEYIDTGEFYVGSYIDGKADQGEDREYYFSNGTTTLCITDQGACLMNRSVTSIVIDGDELVSVTSAEESTFTIEVNEFDLGRSGIKTVTGVELGCVGCEDLTVEVRHRYENVAPALGPAVPINKHGFAKPRQSGVSFAVRIRGSITNEPQSAAVSRLMFGYQDSDKRNKRGTAPDAGSIAPE